MINNITTYPATHIIKLVEKITELLGISDLIYLAPLRVKVIDKNAYVVKVSDGYVIFISHKHLKEDKITPFIIRMLIHEIWHIKQMNEGRLVITDSLFTWQGKDYPNNTQIEFRKWESEARQAELIYYKTIKNKLL